MAFDEEGNGVITKAELLKILKANHFASHDAEVARKADTIMAQSDKDGDGVITFDEFTLVAKKVLSTSTQCVLSPFPPRTSPHPLSSNLHFSSPTFYFRRWASKGVREKPESCTVVVLVHTLSTMPIKERQNLSSSPCGLLRGGVGVLMCEGAPTHIEPHPSPMHCLRRLQRNNRSDSARCRTDRRTEDLCLLPHNTPRCVVLRRLHPR
jgi:hypothetical protein